MMTPLDAALRYVDKFGWPVFPRPGGRFIKDGHGWKDATTDFDQICAWWELYPTALIAMPTGAPSGIIVLDIDVKNGKDGFHTLEEMERTPLPNTPMVCTPSGGLHLYFSPHAHLSIGLAIDKGGKDSGLDILGEGGNIALPTPGWGYRWDHDHHPGNTPFLPAPSWFATRRENKNGHSSRLDPTEILSQACRNIRAAGPGRRHVTLNREAYMIACVVARGALSESTAWHELQAATLAMAADANRNKAARDLEDAFKAGLRKGRRP